MNAFRLAAALCLAGALQACTEASVSLLSTDVPHTTVPAIPRSTALATATSQPKSPPTLTPAPTTPQTAAATAAPPLRTTAPTVAPVSLCGAPPNPWNYGFCAGTTTTAPPSNFCSYFSCIASFATGRGYVVQCGDLLFSKSGGISGSCSQHGGTARTLYAP